jgi:hypothetical protein
LENELEKFLAQLHGFGYFIVSVKMVPFCWDLHILGITVTTITVMTITVMDLTLSRS